MSFTTFHFIYLNLCLMHFQNQNSKFFIFWLVSVQYFTVFLIKNICQLGLGGQEVYVHTPFSFYKFVFPSDECSFCQPSSSVYFSFYLYSYLIHCIFVLLFWYFVVLSVLLVSTLALFNPFINLFFSKLSVLLVNILTTFIFNFAFILI